MCFDLVEAVRSCYSVDEGVQRPARTGKQLEVLAGCAAVNRLQVQNVQVYCPLAVKPSLGVKSLPAVRQKCSMFMNVSQTSVICPSTGRLTYFTFHKLSFCANKASIT